jgi:hypothetical protein
MIMKRVFMCALALCMIANTFAQNTEATVTKTNSWLKAGISAGVPVGNISNFSSATLGLELSARPWQHQISGLA